MRADCDLFFTHSIRDGTVGFPILTSAFIAKLPTIASASLNAWTRGWIALSSALVPYPMACVTGAGAGVDSAREQGKLEARKMLENATRREAAVPGVQCTLC